MYKLLKLFDYSPVQRTLSVVYMLVTRHFLVPTRYTGTVGQRAIKQAYHSQQYILLPRLKSLYALFCCALLCVAECESCPTYAAMQLPYTTPTVGSL